MTKKMLLVGIAMALVVGVVSTGTMRAEEAQPAPFPGCEEFRDIVLHCPSDATGCGGLGIYGGTSFVLGADPGGTARDRICVEPGNRSYAVRATPGTVLCFPEIGEARTVSYSCAGTRLQIH